MNRYVHSQSTATGWTAAGYVFRGELADLAVSGATSPVSIAAGSGIVYGVWYLNDASTTLAIPTPVTNPRIDRVILRYSSAAQTVRITRLAGTEAASPTAPTLTQNSTTFEVSLAQVRITTGGACTVTDERSYVVNPGALGAVDGTTLAVTSNKIGVNSAGTITVAAANVNGQIAATGQIVSTKVGSGVSNSGVVVSSTQPSMAFYETDQSVDNRAWDVAVEGAVLQVRAVNDAGSSAANAITVTRGSGAAISSVGFPNGNVSITNSLATGGSETVAGNSTVTGQVQSNRAGVGASSGVYVNSAQPALALSENDQGADGKRWDVVASGGVLSIRAVNDADSSATNVMFATRSGATVTGLTLAPNVTASSDLAVGGNATVTGNLTVSGTVSLPNNSIQTAEIQDSQITAAKIASDAVTTVKILDANVTTAKVADDAIDDTKVGNRVPQFYRRQGGSATDWTSQGTTTFTPTTVRMQAGAGRATWPGSSAPTNALVITFPQAFKAGTVPQVYVQSYNNVLAFGCAVSATNTGFSAYLVALGTNPSAGTQADLTWFAIGDE